MEPEEQELFLVRIWAEPRELPGRPSIYRARIEHVRSSRTGYVRQLDQIPAFVRACLADGGELPPGGFVDELEPRRER